MEGNAEEQKATRKARRRALIVSIIVQILVLATLVMYPLVGRGERLVATVFTPLPPYTYSPGPVHPVGDTASQGKTLTGRQISEPPRIPTTITTVVPGNPPGGNNEPDGLGIIPGAPDGPNIPGALIACWPEIRPVAPQQEAQTHEVRRISRGHIESAMLIHRVEPVYPILPLQMHREGRVELHAIIATDGSIQSLEVISGDPLFYASALAAVREWWYRPTKLDGQAVEVDTQISVIYTLNR